MKIPRVYYQHMDSVGHDSFLLKVPKFLNTLGDYIKTAYSKN